MTENERIKRNRDYFELGCQCIEEQSIAKLDAAVPDANAVAYYESACHCSRNYFKKNDTDVKAHRNGAII